MAKIFLSYRRSDSQYATRSISDRLQQSLGKEALFQDVKSVSLGEDFEKRVNTILTNCEVMLVIMGDGWLTVQEEDGSGRRLDNPNDLVRREVAAALINENTVVIPVLTGNAEMPKPDDLPDDLKALSTRNAAVVRADASFESQMDALINEIERQVPELRPVMRYGKFAFMGVAAIAVVGIALAIYLNIRAPEDLSSIRWNEEQNVVTDIEFGKTKFHGITLRTSEEAGAITGAEVEKYDLIVDVEDKAEHVHENAAEDGFNHAAEHANLLEASIAFSDDLPDDDVVRQNDGAFVRLEGGPRYGTALVSLTFRNKDGSLVTPAVTEIGVFAPRDIERKALSELDRVVAMVRDETLDDKTIWDDANTMLNSEEPAFTLENGDGLTYNDVLTQDQRNVLADRVTNAQDALTKFEHAASLKADESSLADRRQAWRDYVEAATALGRSASPQITAANAELDNILSFSETEMDVVTASTCTDVNNRNCSGPKTCFNASDNVTSWARLLVRRSEAGIMHRLVDAAGQVVDSGSSVVSRNTSSGYRSFKSLYSDGATGEFKAQITYKDTVVSSIDLCIGSCEACP